jgi:hypothetical protein
MRFGLRFDFRNPIDVGDPASAGLSTADQYAAAELKAAPVPFATFHPLVGGMPIDLAWSSLRLFEREVLPALA